MFSLVRLLLTVGKINSQGLVAVSVALVPGDTVAGDTEGTEFMHKSNSSSMFNFSSLFLKLEADF